ncbi:MAG: transglutaminase-like domain-containing protein [Oscillospiraceae bacterium]|nr:transglutaminase-like domain-containing protein [Oscillospiraceae bacterium]
MKKKFIAFIILTALFINVSYAYQETPERVFTLITSHDPDRCAVLTAEGNTIHAEGFFKDYIVEDFFINVPLREMESRFTRDADGSFSAAYSGIPSVSNALAVIKLDNGTTLNYRVEYSDGIGWFFGDNGLAEKTAATLEDYRVISPGVSENYISAGGDPREIAETREILLQIVEEITVGLDCDYQKAKALNQWVADNIVYDRDARDSDVTEYTVSVATTLRLRRSVCIGIANTYGALLEAAGLKVLNIKGGIANALEGVPYELLPTQTIAHEWVAFWFEAENRWVYADPTWDRQGYFENNSYHYRTAVIKHFDISGLALSFDHRGDRAELRQFFAQTNDEAEELELDTPPETPPPDILTSDTPEPPGENNNFLYMAIGALLLAAVIMVIIILKYRK